MRQKNIRCLKKICGAFRVPRRPLVCWPIQSNPPALPRLGQQLPSGCIHRRPSNPGFSILSISPNLCQHSFISQFIHIHRVFKTPNAPEATNMRFSVSTRFVHFVWAGMFRKSNFVCIVGMSAGGKSDKMYLAEWPWMWWLHDHN